jgi:pilus assembly protein CpaB
LDRKVLLAAIAVTIAGAVLLYLHQERFKEETVGGQPVSVLMATQDIRAGTLLSKEMIGVRQLPQKYVEGRHIMAADAQRILGVRAQTTVRANSSLLWTDVSMGDPGQRDLSMLIKTGMRAITIKATATVGLLRPGDRVDVLLTREDGSKPILQNILILAVGRNTGMESIKQSKRDREQITLSVTVPQAQLLMGMEGKGKLTLILRNPDDVGVLDSMAPEAGGSASKGAEK